MIGLMRMEMRRLKLGLEDVFDCDADGESLIMIDHNYDVDD